MYTSRSELEGWSAVKTIAANLTSITNHLQSIATNTTPNLLHVPIVVPHTDGTRWGVFCYYCSTHSRGPVRCQLPEEERNTGPNGEWPTELFPDYNDLALRKIERVRRVAAGVLMDTPAGDPRQFVAQQIISVLDDD